MTIEELMALKLEQQKAQQDSRDTRTGKPSSDVEMNDLVNMVNKPSDMPSDESEANRLSIAQGLNDSDAQKNLYNQIKLLKLKEMTNAK